MGLTIRILFSVFSILISLFFLSGPAQADSPDSLITATADKDSAELWGDLQGDPAPSGSENTAVDFAYTRPKTKHMYLPACAGNLPTTSAIVLCNNANLMCAGTPAPRDIGYWVFSAPVGSNNWTATGAYVCLGDVDPDEPAPVVPALTGEDFQRLPLPASPIVVQPADGRTLVNVPTNLYADADTVTLPTTILGQPVRVRATPEEFRWRYGDGEGLTTEDAGAPYPELRTAHVYRSSGRQKVGLTTVYSGEYSVGGGPWLPVDGVATVKSPASTLSVVSAQNRLVAGTSS